MCITFGANILPSIIMLKEAMPTNKNPVPRVFSALSRLLEPSDNDILAGKSAGCKVIKIDAHKKERNTISNLLEAINYIMRLE